MPQLAMLSLSHKCCGETPRHRWADLCDSGDECPNEPDEERRPQTWPQPSRQSRAVAAECSRQRQRRLKRLKSIEIDKATKDLQLRLPNAERLPPDAEAECSRQRRRRLKRLNHIEQIKAKEEYELHLQMRGPNAAPLPPDPNDTKITKRAWERELWSWRCKLRDSCQLDAEGRSPGNVVTEVEGQIDALLVQQKRLS